MPNVKAEYSTKCLAKDEVNVLLEKDSPEILTEKELTKEKDF